MSSQNRAFLLQCWTAFDRFRSLKPPRRIARIGTDDEVDCDPADYGDIPDICNMRDWLKRVITEDVREIEQYFRVQRRPSNLMLTRSAGQYARLYQERGLPDWQQVQCAKDAQVMYQIPVNESLYCGTGIDADTVFFPLRSTYLPGVAGWGGDGGK